MSIYVNMKKANYYDKIKSLIVYIPEKDIKYAEAFLKKRDFESLRDLVKSDITILKRKRDLSLMDIIDHLIELKAELDNYLLLIGCEDDDNINFWGC